jgi:YVTN family beta-propeller protein
VIDLTQSPPVVVATVAVGVQPDSAALSANGARLYVANFGGGSVSVIDTATNAVTKTVTVGTRPTGVVEVGGLVYVANLGSQSVSRFDPALAVPTVTSFAVPATGVSLSAPSGVAASANGQRLYVNDARNGKTFVFDLTQSPPVSTGSVLNGTDTFPAYLAVARTTGYSANPGTNSIRVLDLTALTATNVPVGSSPYGVVALPSLGQAFAANSGSDDLTVIDTAGAPTALAPTVATGDVPDAIAVSPDQQTAVVSNEGEGTVSIFHVNQPPQNTVPGGQSMGYNANAAVHNTLVFSTAAGKQISISDADAAAGASPLKVALGVAHGTLTLLQTTGLTFLSGANGQAAMTFTGLQADVNAALNGLVYEPASVFVGSDALSLTVDDQGGTGLGKPQATSSSVAITVNDTAPTDIALSPASVNENQPVATTVGSLAITDADAGEVFAYSLVAGTGSTDNGSFTISGGTLRTNAVFNFEGKSSYSVRVRSTDAGGQFFEKAFTVTINDVNEAPTDIALSPSSLNENQPVGTTIGTLTATDPDTGQTQTFTLQNTGCGGGPFPDNASFAVAGSSLNSAVSFNFEAKASYTICVRTSDSGSPGLSFDKQLAVTINNVNEAPVNTVPATASVNEDTALNFTSGNAVSVADPDAGAGAIRIQLSISNGTLTMTTLTGLTFTVGDGTADAAMTFTGTLAAVNTALATLRYDPTGNFPGAAASGTAAFSITTNDQGNTGSGGPLTDTDGFSVTVNQVNDPPVGAGDSAQTVGNVQLFYDLAPGAGVVGTTKTTPSTNGVLDNDSDPVEGSAVSVTGVVGCADVTTPFDCSTVNGGSITVNSTGRFSFRPAAGSTANDSFQYVLTDNGLPAPASSNVTVNLTFVGNRIWFVKNNAAAGGLGRSNDPFTTLAAAQTAANADGDRVFVYAGDGTTTGQNAGFVFANNNQTLQGEAVALTTGTTVNGINNATLVAAGAQPLIGNAVGIGVSFTNRIGTTVTGLSIAGSTKALEMTTSAATSGTTTITGNTIRGAGAEGIDVNINAGTTGTATIAITNNTWNTAGTHTGNAIDVNRAAGALNLNLSGNTNVLSTGGSGIVIAGGAVASTTITGFAGNSVHGNTAGAGITIGNVTFDSNVGVAGIQQVDGDNLALGASGNPVGGAGLAVTTSQGNLFFDDLDVYAASGTALAASGSGTGFTFTVTPAAPDGVGTSTLDADNGAAVDISTATIDLRLALLESTTAAGGVSLASVGGQFRAPTGSSITKTSGAGTAFNVSNSVSGTTVTYAGTLNVSSGAGVSLSNNTGATINFAGGLSLSTGANDSFVATGGGTVTATQNNSSIVNTASTTSGTALNVTNTTIGASGLTFRSLTSGSASNSSSNGIILNTTGSSGGLTVTGNSTAASGGTIQHKTGSDGSTSQGVGIFLNNTKGPSFSFMQLNDFANYAIDGVNVTGITIANTVVNGTNGTSVGGIGEGDVYFTGLSGSASVTNSTFTGAAYDAFHVFNDGGQTLDRLTIGGSTFGVTNASGNDAIGLQATGGTFKVTVQSSTITAARSDLFQLNMLGTVTSDLVFGGSTAALGNTLTNNNPNIVSGGGGVTIGGGGPTNNITLTYNISHNSIRGAHGAVLAIFKGTGTGASFTGTIDSNTIGQQGTAGSGSTQGEGIAVFQDGAGTSITTITNNHVSGVVAGRGAIDLFVHNGAGGQMTATVQANTIDTLDQANSFSGMYIQTGSATGGSGDNNKSCLTLGGAAGLKNSVDLGGNAGSALVAGITLEQEGTSRVGLLGSPNYSGTPYDFTAVQSYVGNNNNPATNGNGAINVFAFGDAVKPAGGGYFGAC